MELAAVDKVEYYEFQTSLHWAQPADGMACAGIAVLAGLEAYSDYGRCMIPQVAGGEIVHEVVKSVRCSV